MSKFLFHTGSIKSPNRRPSELRNSRLFLFHTGSIKSDYVFFRNLNYAGFLFHTGSIKSSLIFCSFRIQ